MDKIYLEPQCIKCGCEMGHTIKWYTSGASLVIAETPLTYSYEVILVECSCGYAWVMLPLDSEE